ncbi:MAG: serine protease, partial [[Mycobacterium] stephanolepidis]
MTNDPHGNWAYRPAGHYSGQQAPTHHAQSGHHYQGQAYGYSPQQPPNQQRPSQP